MNCDLASSCSEPTPVRQGRGVYREAPSAGGRRSGNLNEKIDPLVIRHPESVPLLSPLCPPFWIPSACITM